MGDNVGDIAGMGSDLFGSLAESTCAALVVSSVSQLGEHHNWVRLFTWVQHLHACCPKLLSTMRH